MSFPRDSSVFNKFRFASLPVELFYEIHIYARNPNLPIASKHIYMTLSNAPRSVKALYILNIWTSYPTIGEYLVRGGLNRILKYPICTREVIEYCFTLLVPPYHLRPPSNWTEPPPWRPTITIKMTFSIPSRLIYDIAQPSTRKNAAAFVEYLCNLPPVYCQRLPDRLERGILVLCPIGNSEKPLVTAIEARSISLVRSLLRCGMHPGSRNNAPVRAAIEQRDLALVKLVIDGDMEPMVTSKGDEMPDLHEYQRISVPVDRSMLKRAIKMQAKDIVEWFIKDKGLTLP